MGKLTIDNLSVTMETSATTSILLNSQQNFQDWMHACGGKGRCTTCQFRMITLQGEVSPLTNREQHYRASGELPEDSRLACQTRLLTGELVVSIPETSQLPHLTYRY